jgi:TonB-linked SusC/RagA family outer membrane protein
MKRKLCFLGFLFFCVNIAWSQTRTVSGRVIADSTKLPLSDVSVSVKGSKLGVKTDNDGKYTISLPAGGNPTLVFTSVGYTSHEVTVGQKTTIDITLFKTFGSMNEIVIIGYQGIPKKDLLAANSQVSAKDIKDNPLNNVAEVLQGKLAGVQITMSEGAPGAEAIINIRGRGSITQSSEPLYVVDGVPTDNALTVLNPQDIATINVLKDAASTAIYGSRGANGVVVITTKGGKNTGGRTVVNYNMYYGVQKLAQKIPMMDAYDFVAYQYEKSMWRADSSITRYINSPISWDQVEAYKDYPTYDWQERTMGKDALQSSHNISLSGGNANTTYNLSLTANKQNGILINSDLDRKNLNFRLDHKGSEDVFRFGFNARYTDQRINGAGTSDAGGAGANRLRQYTRYKPLILPGEEEDAYDATLDLNNAGNGFNILNPILLANAETRRRLNNQLNLNGYIQINLLKNLSFRSTAAVNFNRTRNQAFDDTLTNNAKSYQKQPLIQLVSTEATQISNSNVLTYSNPVFLTPKNYFSVLLGQEIQKTVNMGAQQDIRYFPIGITADKAFNNLQLAAPSTTAFPQPLASSSRVPTALASFFGTIDYNYDQRYYAKFTMRSDGTSIFGENNRWGYFPSGAVSWRISRENFFKSNFVNDLRVRYSYGASGNNRITPFSYRTQYSSPANGGYGLNGALTGIFIPANLGNLDLKWESQIAQNFGVDLSLFNNRLSATIDGYYNKSKNLLLNQSIPSSSGYTTQFQNIGATRNIGLELQLSGTILSTKDISYNASFNISFNKNKITSLGPNKQLLRNSGWFSTNNFPADYVLKVGEQVGAMYGYVNDGYYTVDDFDAVPFSNPLYPQYNTQYILKKDAVTNAGILADPLQPGSPKFKDLGGPDGKPDGKVDADNDRTIIGYAQPRFFGGFNQSFTYKGFELNVFANFVYGNKVFNANKLEYASSYGSQVNMLTIDNGRWKMIDENGNSIQRVVGISGTNYILGVDPETLRKANEHASIWFPSTSVNGFYSQSYAVEDGSYIRINNVTLAYNVPKSMISKIKMTGLRIYGTVNNLATITGYTGYDPDANTRRSDPTTFGVDYAAYPRARTFVAGINVTF